MILLVFGNDRAVIEHTCKRLQMRIKNPSAMEVSYVWAFYNHDPREDIQVSLEARKKSKGLKLPLNQIFDILPIRATLYPGEQELVEVSYYAFPGYKIQATAVCRVPTSYFKYLFSHFCSFFLIYRLRLLHLRPNSLVRV